MEPQFKNPVPPKIHPPLFIWVLIIAAALIGSIQVWQNSIPKVQPISTIATTSEFSDWKTYKNEEYGFEFKYPEELSDFRVEENKYDQLTSLDFIMDSSNTTWINNTWTAFSISVWTKTEWDKQQALDEPSPMEVARNGAIIFGGMKGHDCPGYKDQPDIESKYCFIYKNVSKILSTFKFVSTSTTVVLPPDPGEAGKATLEGIDSDHDGVRDDVQRYIALTYPNSAKTRAALTQLIKTDQTFILQSNNEQGAIDVANLRGKDSDCLSYILGVSVEAFAVEDNLRAQFLNTSARKDAYKKADKLLGGEVFYITPEDEMKAQCNFNPDSFTN